MAVVDVSKKCGYSLSVQQTPPNSSSKDEENQPETTRINHYLTQLEATVPYLPTSLRYVVSDGFYSKIKWVEGVTNLKLEAIGKLRRDGREANPLGQIYVILIPMGIQEEEDLVSMVKKLI
jgi:hypothetical protein